MGNTRICDYRRRPPRIEQLSSGVRPFYFVTFNTHKRLPLLARPEIHETFRSFCFIAQEHEVAVGRYVLAPEHTCMSLCHCPRQLSGSKNVQALRAVIGKQLLKLGYHKRLDRARRLQLIR